jgi:hypothetical protein
LPIQHRFSSLSARAFALCAVLIATSVLMVAAGAQDAASPGHPTLDDFWDGRAEWAVIAEDVGLPVGESDTLAMGDGVYWSYLHASQQSAGVIDQCGMPVAFPGCLTRWESVDGGATFSLPIAVCSIPCASCPCDDARDHIGPNQATQQYPRIHRVDEADGSDEAFTYYLAYEWHAQIILRRSPDGVVWSDWAYLTTPGGTWPSSFAPCGPTEKIGPHPNIRGEIHDCLVGAPPGIYVEGDTLYVFAAAGSAPGHMRCYKGDRHGDLGALRVCDHDPLFSGAATYGPVELTGADANVYFDFRYVSSADLLKVGERYYMSYEGIRGPDALERGMDTQFGLGFARSVGPQIDGPWEKYPGNPVVMDLTFNWGVGHADLLVIDGQTLMYSATSQSTRGQYALVWK